MNMNILRKTNSFGHVKADLHQKLNILFGNIIYILFVIVCFVCILSEIKLIRDIEGKLGKLSTHI